MGEKPVSLLPPLKYLITNFYAASSYDPISSGWNFCSWWSPQIFQSCFYLKNDSVSNFMQSHPDLGVIPPPPPPRIVDSRGSDAIDIQGFMKKLFLCGLFATLIKKTYNKQFKQDVTEFASLFLLFFFTKDSWFLNFFKNKYNQLLPIFFNSIFF